VHGRCSCLLSSRSNTHSLSTQLNSPWNHPVFCYIMCARDLQRDSCGFSRYLLSSTDENIFGLDSEGLAVCKGRRDPVKNILSLCHFRIVTIIKGSNYIYIYIHIFEPEDEGTRFIRSVGIYVLNYRGADKSLALRGGETSSEACQGHARFKQNRDASCHQVSFLARQGAEGNSRHSDRNISLFPS